MNWECWHKLPAAQLALLDTDRHTGRRGVALQGPILSLPQPIGNWFLYTCVPSTLRQQSVWWCCLLVSQWKTHVTFHKCEQSMEGIDKRRSKYSIEVKIDSGSDVGIEHKGSCWRNSCVWECGCPCCLRGSRCAAGGTSWGGS